MKNLALLGLCLALASEVWAQSQSGVETVVLAKTQTSWEGSALPAYPQGQPEVTVLRVIIPPKIRLPMHEHPVMTAGVVLSGHLIVETESGEVLHLNAGEAAAEVVDQWHYGRNDGEEPVELIVFYAGIRDQPVSIAKPNGQ